jgi:hypothetical protein
VLAFFVCPSAASAKRVEITMPSTPATEVTATSARLTAIVDSNKVSTFHVEIGHTTAYGFTTAEYTNTVTNPATVWVTVYGLAPLTTYHFRVVATNYEGTTRGPDRSFTTLLSLGALVTELLTDVAPGAAPGGTTTPGTPSTPSNPLSPPDLTPPLRPADPATPAVDASSANGAAAVLLPQESKPVVVGPVSGSVSVQAPGGSSFKTLRVADEIPVGSVVDARRGVLELSSDSGSSVDTGRFWGAVFRVRQPAHAGAVTELTLLGGRPTSCKPKAAARAAKAAPPRGLWGKDHKGRFRTRGRNSVATVRGTVWYVAERCAGTLTRVVEGAVVVRDTRRGKTVVVKAGHHVMVRDSARSAARRG